MPTSKEILADIANQEENKQEETKVETVETPEPEIEHVEASVVESKDEVINKVETPTEPTEPATLDEAAEGPIELSIPDPEPEPFDFASYIKDTGIDAKDPDEFKSKVKDLINKEDPLKVLPDKVRKAVEFAMQGGDIYELLKVSQVDYSQIEPKAIYESYIRSMVKDQDKATEHLESLSDVMKEIEGEKMRQEYMRQQERQEQDILKSLESKTQAEVERKKENEARLKETLNNVEDISGFKVKPVVKDQFYKEVVSGNLTKRLFFDDKGDYDYNKMFKVAFLADNFDKIQNYYKDRVATATKRETIEELTNPQLDNPTGVPKLDTTEPDPLLGWAKTLREGATKR
jgi:hypothetical protein